MSENFPGNSYPSENDLRSGDGALIIALVFT
jgi:hypothetical protein